MAMAELTTIEMDPGPGGLKGQPENETREASEHMARLVTTMAQQVNSQLIPPQDTNIYTENRVITYTSEPTQPVYTQPNSAGYVTSQIVQDGTIRYVDSKELIGIPERDASYAENREIVVTPDSARQMVQTSDATRQMVQTSDSTRQMVQTPDATRQMIQTPDSARQMVQTPDATRQMVQTPDSARQMVQTPDATRQMVQTPDATRQMVQTSDSARQMVQTPDPTKQMVQTPDPPRQMVLSANVRPGYGDTNIVTLPNDAQQVIATTNANSPIVLVPDANIRPIVPSSQHVNTRNLISSVIDSTRLAMPASLSNTNANLRQIISTGNETTLHQSLAVHSAITKPIMHNVDANKKQLIPNPIREQINIPPAGDNRQYILRPDGTVGIINAPQVIENQEGAVYAEKREMESPIESNRFIDSKDLVYVQNEGGVRYVKDDGVSAQVPAPTVVEHKSVHHQEPIQPETATTYNQNKPVQYSEYSTRFVNSSGGEIIPMSHAIVSYPENGPLGQQPSPQVATNADEGLKEVPGHFPGVGNNVVSDALKAAVESSGIVPSPLTVVNIHEGQHQPMETVQNYTPNEARNGTMETSQSEENGHENPNDQVTQTECEKNNSLIHFKRCFQFLVEENCEVSSDSVQPVLNILKNTVKYLTQQLHKCVLSDQAGFTWEPAKADDMQYLIPSCQCGYAANKPIVTNSQILSGSESQNYNGEMEDESPTENATKSREKADAIDEGNKTNSTKKSKSKAAKVTDEDEDFSPHEEDIDNDDDDDEDWNAPPKPKRRGRPRKATKISTKRGRKASPKQRKAPTKAAPKPSSKVALKAANKALKKAELEKSEVEKTEEKQGEETQAPKKRGRPKKAPLAPGEKKEVVKRHVCEICGSKFKHKAELRRHSTVHTGERPFSCEICGQTFKRHGHLYEHRLVHTGKNIVYCPHCNKKLKSKVALRNHIKTQHEKNLQHMCQICGRKWLTPSMLKYHIHNQHNTERVRCPKCPAAFAKALEMREHLRTHTNLPHICFICGDGFMSGKDALAHRDIQHADRLRNRCHQCGRGFQYATELRKHEATVHAKGALPFKCAWAGCTKTFAKEYMMKYHMKMWHECETKACEICFKQIKVRVYKRHMLTHTGVKDFRCQYCVAAFSQVGNLKRHMRIHTGEKPYKCTYCEKAFNQSNALKQHQNMHIGGSHRDNSSTHVAHSNQTAIATSQIASSQIVTNQIPAPQFTTTEISANQLLTQLTSGQLAASQLTTTQLTATQLANQLPRFSHPSHPYGFPSN